MDFIFNSLEHAYSCDDSSSPTDKMMYSSARDTLSKSFKGLDETFQVNDLAGVDYDAMFRE